MFANISGRKPSTCYGFTCLPASHTSIRLDLRFSCVSFDSIPKQGFLLFTLYCSTAMCFCLVTLLGVASFFTADRVLSVPCRLAFEQDVEHGNTDGLGDCQSKQGLFTLIFPTPLLFSSPSPHHHSFSLSTHFLLHLFLSRLFSRTCLSLSLFHPSAPFSSCPLLSFSGCFCGFSTSQCCALLGKDILLKRFSSGT